MLVQRRGAPQAPRACLAKSVGISPVVFRDQFDPSLLTPHGDVNLKLPEMIQCRQFRFQGGVPDDKCHVQCNLLDLDNVGRRNHPTCGFCRLQMQKRRQMKNGQFLR